MRGLLAPALLACAAAASTASAARVRQASARRRLNEALHELRRPVQGLALLLETESAPVGGAELVDQVAYGLSELDVVVNGGGRCAARATLTAAELAAEARRRWGGRIELEESAAAGELRIWANRRRLAAALDNLIANALEHGAGPVRLRARSEGSSVRLDVTNGGPPRPQRVGGDPRRGHGLRVVERIAAEHRGTARGPHAATGGTVAGIAVPRLPVGR